MNTTIKDETTNLGFINGWKHVLSLNIFLAPGLFRIFHMEINPDEIEFTKGLTPGSKLVPESIINDLVYTEPVDIYLSDIYYQLSEKTIIIRCKLVPSNKTIVKSELIEIGNEIVNELTDSGFETDSSPYFY